MNPQLRDFLRNSQNLPDLTHKEILGWADEYFRTNGKWPNVNSGPIVGTEENWRQIDSALREGIRGLNSGSSLAQLLGEHRGLRNIQDLPDLTTKQILAWADKYHNRTSRWPNQLSGPIKATSGETWAGINYALSKGSRGLQVIGSLAELLATHRGVRNQGNLPPLTKEQILSWSDAHQKRTDRWPRREDGVILEAPSETWRRIDNALRLGLRGLAAGSSLANLLVEQRGVRHKGQLPPLTEQQILAWLDEHFQKTGKWPKVKAGPIDGAAGETWSGVNAALEAGLRNLPGGSSLAKLLARHRGVRNRAPRQSG